jgi:REP element-mobilizing transposase RayT
MLPKRKSIRLQGYDYSQEGCYFVTICTKKREPIFGSIINGVMELSNSGIVVTETWLDLENHNPDIQLGEFVIMPNHVHGIIQIYEPVNLELRAGRGPAPTNEKRTPLSEIMRQFKTFSAKRINETRGTPSVSVWQRSYFDRIIGTEQGYENAARYICDNPMNWENDEENRDGDWG